MDSLYALFTMIVSLILFMGGHIIMSIVTNGCENINLAGQWLVSLGIIGFVISVIVLTWTISPALFMLLVITIGGAYLKFKHKSMRVK